MKRDLVRNSGKGGVRELVGDLSEYIQGHLGLVRLKILIGLGHEGG
jgi:hypothetical protein